MTSLLARHSRRLSTSAARPTALVIGNGCFGVGAAYFLARQGMQVTVLDKRDGVAMGTTLGNASSLRQSSFGAAAGPGAVPAMLKSLYNHDGTYRLRLGTLLTDTHLWSWGLRFLATCVDKSTIGTTESFLRDNSPYFSRLTYAIAKAEGFASKVDGAQDTTVVFVDCGADGKSGSNGTAPSDGTAAAFAAAAAKASQPPPVPWATTHALTPSEVVPREPALARTLNGSLAGGVLPPHDSLLDSHGFTTELATVLAQRYGVRFVHGAAGDVTALVEDADGARIESVATSDGTYHGADVIVVANGSHAPKLLGPLGVDVPIYPVKGYSLTYEIGADCPASAAPSQLLIVEPAQMYVSRFGARLRFTSIAEFAGWAEDQPAEDCVRVLRHRAESLFPDATVGREPAIWCGGRPLTPDDRPISGRVARRWSNLYLHSGGGQYGWRVAMGTSEHLAELMLADKHVSRELSDAATSRAPSLAAAGPRTRWEASILSLSRFELSLSSFFGRFGGDALAATSTGAEAAGADAQPTSTTGATSQAASQAASTASTASTAPTAPQRVKPATPTAPQKRGAQQRGISTSTPRHMTTHAGYGGEDDEAIRFMSQPTPGDAAHRPSHVRLTFGSTGASARVRLLWDDAPRTVAAILSLCEPATGKVDVMGVHARHSGAEALFLTPRVLRDVGDENTTLPVARGDVLFCYEPAGVCNHATEDASEVAWVYHDACVPRRWVSVGDDPTNQTPPYKTVDVALNAWGKVEESGQDADGAAAFYETSAKLPRLGEQPLTMSIER